MRKPSSEESLSYLFASIAIRAILFATGRHIEFAEAGAHSQYAVMNRPPAGVHLAAAIPAIHRAGLAMHGDSAWLGNTIRK